MRMKRQYRIGIAGFEHMHIVEHVEYFLRKKERFLWIGGVETAFGRNSIEDAPFTAGQNLKKCMELGVLPHMYENWEQLIREKPDLVLIGSENSMHTSLVCALVEKGIHVLVDKPLAYKLEDARKMKEASERGGGVIITNWPIAWKPSVRFGEEVIRSGALGEVLRIHFHNPDSLGPFCHGENVSEEQQAGEWWFQKECGGGSLIDYCCYGCSLLLEYLHKRPEQVVAVTKNFLHPFGDAEDYAGLLLNFDRAVGLLEGTWSTYASGSPTGPVVWGTKGAMVVDYGKESRVDLYQEQFSKTPSHSYTQMENQNLDGRQSIEEEVLHFLDTGKNLLPMLEFRRNMEVAVILEAAIHSAKSQKMETILYE